MSGMELWWLGQSGFRLRGADHGPVFFIDPFLSPHRSRTWPCPATIEDLAQADAVLCTHEHIDHFDKPAIQAAAALPGSRFKLIIPQPIVPMALELNIPEERVIGVQPDQDIEAGGAHVTPLPASHGVNVSDAYNFGEALSGGLIRYLGFVVELGGVRAYHAGDTIPYDGLEDRLKILTPDIALLPINGRDYFREKQRNLVGNMDAREAASLAAGTGIHTLVPMHWELFPHNQGFPEELIQYIAEHTPQITVLVMGRGQKVIIKKDQE